MTGLERARDVIARWQSPECFVREELNAEPDRWQDEVLKCFPYTSRIAISATMGAGATALEAWICWYFLLTRPHARISVVGPNLSLRDGLWPEMARWHKMSGELSWFFGWSSEKIFARHSPDTWFMGRHISENMCGDYVMFVLHEPIEESMVSAAITDAERHKEGHVILTGKPISRVSPLFRACQPGSDWRAFEVNGDPDDPRYTPRVSAAWAREQIQQYGRHDPWVMANVLGKFP